jgi:hypothetical protein
MFSQTYPITEQPVIGWPSKPFIYEINTWVWLNTLSHKHHRPITLDNVPDETLDELAALGIDAVWMMGVWTRSPLAIQTAHKYSAQYLYALPDLTDHDLIGSAYAIGAYQVDENLGGRIGLALFRKRLHQRGIKLILDYVPNHVAIDHAWTRIHPEYMLLGTADDLTRDGSSFFSVHDTLGRTVVIAHGRDPYFPGWIDTAQVNAFSLEYRKAALTVLLDIAEQCDGVRCDMAMLLLNNVFAHTWGDYVGKAPKTEFWAEIIPQLKRLFPGFLFIAEVYWNLEYTLQQLGFDYTYDKLLYDRVLYATPADIRAHLVADVNFQRRMIRFIENHDEPRAFEKLGLEKSRPAAVATFTLPGAVLVHDGQITGRCIKLPVQIGRQPNEPVNEDLYQFYRRLLAETRSPIYQNGDWWLFDVAPKSFGDQKARGEETAAPFQDNAHNILAFGWRNHDDNRLILVNLTPQPAAGVVDLDGWQGFASPSFHLYDALNRKPIDGVYVSSLQVELEPYGAYIFRLQPI